MSFFLNTVTNEYPRHIGDLEALGWVQGTELPQNWVEVEVDTPPICKEDELAEPNAPLQDDSGKWVTTWTIRKMTTSEIKFKASQEIRYKVSLGQMITPEEASLLVAD